MEEPTTLQLIQQWLSENGFHTTLKEFESESSLSYNPSDIKLGGQLESIINENRELKQFSNFDDTKREEKQSSIKLLERGDNDYVKGILASSDSLHKANILSVSFSHSSDTHYMATGSTDRSVRVFKYPTESTFSWNPEVIAEFHPHNGAVISLDWNPKFKNLLLTSSMDGTVSVVDVSKNEVIQLFSDHTKYVVKVRWYLDGLTFACASHDHSCSIYTFDESSKSYKQVEKLLFSGNAESLSFSKEGKLVVSVRDDNYLHLYDLNTHKKSEFNMNATLDEHVSFTALDLNFSPNSEYLLVNTDKSRLIMYRLESGSSPVRNFYGATNDGFSQPRCLWHPSGKYVYSTCQDNKIYCWEVASQKIVHKLEGHKGVVRDLVHHPSLNVIASCSFDKTVKLWE